VRTAPSRACTRSARGLGISLGPLLGGVAIQASGENYRWVWRVCSAAILVSLAVMRPLRDEL
jgi:MFS family permease